MSSFTQELRPIAVETPLGKDVLLLSRFAGREEVSRLFSYQLELLAEKPSISPKDIVGKNVTFSLRIPDESVRYFNGFVSRFAYTGTDDRFSYYTAEVVPWLWFLTRRADCRIFQHKTIPQIIEQVFTELGFTDFDKGGIKGKYVAWDYCVQYRETDFNFVSRLMEQEGIFYYFRHGQGKHTVVLADQNGAFVDCPEKQVELREGEGDGMITSWEHRYEFTTGKWAQTDFNFETPTASLMAKEKTLVQVSDVAKFEVYDYPGEYEKADEGKNDAKIRMEEIEVGHDTILASSNCRSFTPGGKFSLKSHPSDVETKKSPYVITVLQHSASVEGTYLTGSGLDEVQYSNHFSCIPEKVPFRPARKTPRPLIQGTQTAIVVGPPGEEIYTDKYGRVKVQFHWDRLGKKDQDSSCWIRVSHPWAGKGWGSVAIPRIGQEVIVEFLEGDPDRPIITGRVYNAGTMPPYELPAGGVVSGLKSNSTPGGGGYNEMSMDDTKGKEKITIHGQFDMARTIEHDSTESIINNETVTVGNDRTETVSGNESLTVAKDRTRTVSLNEVVTVALTRTHTVGVNEAITVGAAQEITVGGLQAISVGANQTTTVGVNQTNNIGSNRESSVGKNDTIKVGKKLVIDAGDEVLIKTGDASILMKKDGTIQVKGKDITIKGTGKIGVKADGDVTIKGSKIAAN